MGEEVVDPWEQLVMDSMDSREGQSPVVGE
jgi:hypothetical protein